MNIRAAALTLAAVFLSLSLAAQPKRIYLAADDHTDYMWTADEDTYLDAILKMLDYYIELSERTAAALTVLKGLP